MATLKNRARMTTATTGQVAVALGAATSNAFATFAEAGVADGANVSYVIEENSDFEIGRGTYTATGTTLSRDTVLLSKIGGAAGTTKMTLAGNAEVFLTALSQDIVTAPASSTDNAIPRFDGTNGLTLQNSSAVIDDSGRTHIQTGVTGATASVGADDLVVEGTSAAGSGITILNLNTQNGLLVFGFPGDTLALRLRGEYNSGSPYMGFDILATEEFRLVQGGLNMRLNLKIGDVAGSVHTGLLSKVGSNFVIDAVNGAELHLKNNGVQTAALAASQVTAFTNFTVNRTTTFPTLRLQQSRIHGAGVVASISYDGQDDGGGAQIYAAMNVGCIDDTAGSEDGRYDFFAVAAGVLGTPLQLTSVALFKPGTAALPGITKQSDTDTGIYWPAADQLAFSCGGTKRFEITASLVAVNNSVVYGFGGSASIGTRGNASTGLLEFLTNSAVRSSIDTNGNIFLGNAQLADTATDGFVYIPTTTGGAPTGTPTAKAGMVALIYDDTNNDFYIYNGAWKKVALA